jgi:hypothetical protein
MQQIADWLEKLGMSEYAQRFAENDIDFTILADLTDQDLEKIGVASLGNRRKILWAIAGGEGWVSGGCRHSCCPYSRRHGAANAGRRGLGRAPLRYSDVLRSGGLDKHFRPA